jgi:hypothetical protein
MRRLRVSLLLASVLLLGLTAIPASATPAGPPGAASATVIADGTFVNNVNTNVNPEQIKLLTKGSIEVYQVSNSALPGWTSGWHMHSGPILVNITSGALTFYESDCHPVTVTAGHGWFESTGHPILARNEGTETATWITTQIIPAGASKRVDITPGFCGEE